MSAGDSDIFGATDAGSSDRDSPRLVRLSPPLIRARLRVLCHLATPHASQTFPNIAEKFLPF